MNGRAFSRRIAAIRRLDQRLVRGELGAVGQRDRHQVVERPARVDQRDLRVVVLQRLDHRPGVEPQHLRQVGAARPATRCRAATACCSRSASMFRARSTSTAGTRSPAQAGDPLDQVAAPLDAVQGAGVDPAVLVDPEVGVGGLQQGVVLRRLDVPVPGVQDLPGDQGLEDRVGRGESPVLPDRPAPP